MREMSLSTKVIRDRIINMAENISCKQIKNINSAKAFSITCDDSCDLLCRYIKFVGPQEELIEVIPLKSQTWGQDIFEAVVSCLTEKVINTTHQVSVCTDGPISSTEDSVSLHLPTRSTVCPSSQMCESDEPLYPNSEQNNRQWV